MEHLCIGFAVQVLEQVDDAPEHLARVDYIRATSIQYAIQYARYKTATKTKPQQKRSTAPNSKTQLDFVKHFRIFAVSISKCHLFFAISVQNSLIFMKIEN